MLVIALVVAAIQALIPVVVFVAVYILLPLGVLWLLFALGVHVYYYLNPAAKARHDAEQAAKNASEKAKKAAEQQAEWSRADRRRQHEQELADQGDVPPVVATGGGA